MRQESNITGQHEIVDRSRVGDDQPHEPSQAQTFEISAVTRQILLGVSTRHVIADKEGVKLPARALLHVELPDVVQRALGTWSLRPGRLILKIGQIATLALTEDAAEGRRAFIEKRKPKFTGN